MAGKIMTLKAALLAALVSAAGSGLLVADAVAKVSRRDDDGEGAPPLLLAPPQIDASTLLAHRSHSSHRSHRSHSSGGRASHYSTPSSWGSSSSGSSSSGKSSSGKSSSGSSSVDIPSVDIPYLDTPSSTKPASGKSQSGKLHSGSLGTSTSKPAKPAPLKPAKVSLVALPGGSIFINDKLVGHDETPKLTLKPGVHSVRVENRFLGIHEHVITISEGQSGRMKIEW